MDKKDLPLSKKRAAILAEIRLGAKANALAREYEVSPMTISTWVRKDREAKEKGDLETIKDVPKEVITEVLDEIVEKAEAKAAGNPTAEAEVPKLREELDKISDSIDGLRSLDEEFQETLKSLLIYAKSKITDEMKISEWTQIMKGMSEMHVMMYGKRDNATINIVNNQQNNSVADTFKAGLRR